jgi:hypothetical protein
VSGRQPFPGADPAQKWIWAVKPADRRDEVVRQLAAAYAISEVEDPETGHDVLEITWTPNRFEQVRKGRYVVHGITDALDSNSREALLLSVPGDADVKWLTLALHMVGRIAAAPVE